MPTTSQKIRTSVYLDQEVKDQAKQLFKKYQISLSDAVNMFLSQSVLEQGLPFQMRIPKEVELVRPNEDDYKLIEETKGEETVSLTEFLKL